MSPVEAELRTIGEVAMLALCLWREARGETPLVRTGIAWTVKNRAAKGGWWGSDVIGVITKQWQFSSMTDPKDPQLTKWPTFADPTYLECLELASDVLGDRIPDPFPGEDSYYDQSIPAPDWAKPEAFVGAAGRIKFFDVRGIP
jgi:hypothetical protein